jgi:nucleoside-diphosphate-sugar epimerase
VRNVMRGEEGAVPAAALEWVYSKDAAAGTVQALRARALTTRIFNLTMGTLTSPEDLVLAVRSVFPQARLRIEKPSDSSPALSNMTRSSSLRRSREALGYAPRFAMSAAVRDLAEYLAHEKT